MTLLAGVVDFGRLCSYCAAIRALSAIEGSASHSESPGDLRARKGAGSVVFACPKRLSSSWLVVNGSCEFLLLEYTDSMINRASSSSTGVDFRFPGKTRLLLSPLSVPVLGRSRARCEVVAGGVEIIGGTDLRPSLIGMGLVWATNESS